MNQFTAGAIVAWVVAGLMQVLGFEVNLFLSALILLLLTLVFD